MGKNTCDFAVRRRARDVHSQHHVGSSWSIRGVLAVVVVGGAVACGASESAQFGSPTLEDAGVTADAPLYDVPLPTEDTAPPPTTDAPVDAFAPDKCAPSASKGNGTVCITARRGSGVAPRIDDGAKAIGIDGVGALVIALMPDPWVKTSKPIVIRSFPSATSTAKFTVDGDLPKVADFDVAPGSYFAIAYFLDGEPYGARDFQPGDYMPRMSNGLVIPKVDVTAGGTFAAEIDLFPVRAVDIDVRLKSGVRPLGSASGPLRASLSSTGPDPKMIGEGHLACADLRDGKTQALRLITTSDPDTYWLKVGLFDFAAGPDDPTLDAAGPPASGSIVNYGGGAYGSVGLSKGWITPTVSIELDRVIPFSGAVPADPTPSCTSAYAPAGK